MTGPEVTLDVLYRVWYQGSYIEVGEDRDGLELVELRWSRDHHGYFICSRENAILIVKALESWKPGHGPVALFAEHDETCTITDDADGLGMVELQWGTPKEATLQFTTLRFTFPSEMANILANAIQKYLDGSDRLPATGL